KSGHRSTSNRCPLYPQKRTLLRVGAMSALPPKADIAESDWHVRFVPKADITVAEPCRRISVPHAGRTSARLHHETHGGGQGTVLATRSAFNGSNRPVPCARTAAQETVVRRAVASAHARALRGDLDRR